MTVKGEGMPVFEGRGHGDLFVEFNVVLPSKLSDDMRSSMLSIPITVIHHIDDFIRT